MSQQAQAGNLPSQNYTTEVPQPVPMQTAQQPGNYNDPSQWNPNDPAYQNYNPAQPGPRMQTSQVEGNSQVYNQSVKTNTGEHSPSPNPNSSTPLRISIDHDSSPYDLNDLPSKNEEGYNPSSPYNNTTQIGDHGKTSAKVKVSVNEYAEDNTQQYKNQMPNIIIQIPGMPQYPGNWANQCKNPPQSNPNCNYNSQCNDAPQCNNIPPACKKAKTVKRFKSKPCNLPNEPNMGLTRNTIPMFNPLQEMNPMTTQMYENGYSQGGQFMPMSMHGVSQAESMYRNRSSNPQGRGYGGVVPMVDEFNPQQYPMPCQYGEQMQNGNEAGSLFYNQQPMFMNQEGMFPMTGNPFPQIPMHQNVHRAKNHELDCDSDQTADDNDSDCTSSALSSFIKPNHATAADPFCQLEPRNPLGMLGSAKRKNTSFKTKDQQTSRAQMVTSDMDLSKRDQGKQCEESIQCKLGCPDEDFGSSVPRAPTSTSRSKPRKCTKPSLIPKRCATAVQDELDPCLSLELEIQRQQMLMQQELQNQRCAMMVQQELQNQRQTLLLQRQLQNQRQALLLQQELQNREQSEMLQSELSSVRKKTNSNNNCRNRSRRKCWTSNRMRMTPDCCCRQPMVSILDGGGINNNCNNCHCPPRHQNSLRSEDMDPMEIQIYKNEVSSSNCPCPDQGNSMKSSPACTLHTEYAMKLARLKEHNRLPMLSTLPPTERNSIMTRSRKKRVPETTLMIRGCRCDNITSSCLSSDSPPCEFPSVTSLGLQQLKKDKNLELDNLTAPGTMSMSKVIKFQAKFGKSDGDE
ncbi:unnamed protein product [Allacma fusca]|uniref:Uncharacterized protein n=1 Tax=Allacma fusca TaxID=39272 RepID=A0A8J2K9G1_9HEXA|nr:unnamed protein product [Allacma fusca]